MDDTCQSIYERVEIVKNNMGGRFALLLCMIMVLNMVLPVATAAGTKTVSETICFDICKGAVSITDTGYSGWVIDENGGTGEAKTVTLAEGQHISDYSFVVKQSSNNASINVDETDGSKKEYTLNTISVGSAKDSVDANVSLTLNGVHIGIKSTGETLDGKAAVYVNAGTGATVSIVLADNSNNILYGGNNRAGLEKGGGDDALCRGTLVLTCEKGKNEGHQCQPTDSCGKLQATGGGNLWCAGAGIGACGHGSGGTSEEGVVQGTNALTNLQIRGGIITAKGALGKDGPEKGYSGGSAGIGMGVSQSNSVVAGTVTGLKISGGYIAAEGGDYSTAGIGGAFFSGYVAIEITGGTICANKALYEDGAMPEEQRAPGIGGAGGGTASAAKSGATINISGGTIHSYSKYGAGIGSGGGGSNSEGAPAKVKITGGTVYAESIYGAAIGSGGSIGKGVGGDATVEISGGNVTAVTNGNGAAIGSAAGKETGNGGNAKITIKGGTIKTAGNGKGAGIGAGAGGRM